MPSGACAAWRNWPGCSRPADEAVALLERLLCADVLRAVLTEHELVYGEVIRTGFRRALKTKLRAPADRIAAAEAVFAGLPAVPKPKAPHSIETRARDDRWILAMAVDGRADVLVTGDQDLLSVAGQAPLPGERPRPAPHRSLPTVFGS